MPVRINLRIAQRFEEVADLIEQQSGNPFRARAYRRAAETLRRTPRSVREVLDAEGKAGLEELKGIGVPTGGLGVMRAQKNHRGDFERSFVGEGAVGREWVLIIL